MQQLSDKFQLTELANKLFMYTDAQQWQQLLDEVFAEEIFFDMQSAGGGEPKNILAVEICRMWEQGFRGLDAVHHQAGHYLIDVENNLATIYAYALATHYKRSGVQGNTRVFVGSYDLRAIRTPAGWRLCQFKYNLKYMDGNVGLN